MKKHWLFFIILFNLVSLNAQNASEKARMKRNNDWKSYLTTMDKNFKTTKKYAKYSYRKKQRTFPASFWEFLQQMRRAIFFQIR